MSVFVLGVLDDDVEWLVQSLGDVTVPVRVAPDADGLAVVVHRSPGSVVHRLLARGGRTAGVAAALWERRSRELLSAAAGHPAVLVSPSAGAPAQVASFLAGHGVSASLPARSSAPAPDGMGPWPPSPERERLASVLRGLTGGHAALAPGDLGAETPSTDALVAADRCFDEERRRLERCLATAAGAVEGLFPAPAPAPLAFGLRAGPDAGADDDAYRRWIRRHEHVGDHVAHGEPAIQPVVSVVVAVSQPDPALLRRCLASVADQTSRGWELCLATPAGDATTAALAEWPGLPSQVRVARVTVTDVVETAVAVNAGAEVATGELLAFVDQHDVLAPNAIAAVVEALVAAPEADVVYTDEDDIDGDGARSNPSFKPGWSPDLLLSTMYVGRLLVVRRSLFDAIGGLRSGLGDAMWHDLALRATEQARGVAHAPTVAYHRDTDRRPADDGDSRPAATAVADALARRGVDAGVEPGRVPGSLRARYRIAPPPLVSVIVPFRDGAGLLRRCVDSVRSSGYDRWELVLVDNRSWEPETAALRRMLAADPRCRVVDDRRPFSWAAINNAAVEHANGDVVLFLNSDVEAFQPGWLEAMVEHAQRPEVGAVGARLLYPDGRIQHAGVVMGLGGGAAWHAFCLCPGDQPGYLGHAGMVRDYSAVTGACMMVRTELFRQVGGFDEGFTVCFNDVDFCLRLRQAGYLVVYTPFAELVHHESSARGMAVDEREVHEIMQRWAPVIRRDPYFNPNLDARRAECALPR